MKPIVIIDGNFFLTAACHAPRIDSDTAPTTMFMNGLWDLRYKGDPVVIFDGRRPAFRLEVFPDYKKKPEKEKTPEEKAKEARFKELRSINRRNLKILLPSAGIPVIHHPEYEADDLAFLTAKWLLANERDVILVTEDSDWFQACKYGAQVFRPKHNNELVDRGAFQAKYGFSVDYYPLWLALSGTHNAVPGIGDVGPKRATEIVTQLEEPTVECLKAWSRAGETANHKRVKDKIALVKRNLLLVDLDRVPMSEDEVARTYRESVMKAKADHKAFSVKARELEVARVAQWVPHILKPKGYL